MNFKKILFLSVCFSIAAVCFGISASAQSRDRVVKPNASQPINQPPISSRIPSEPVKPLSLSRPVLTNNIVVATPQPVAATLLKKTASSRAVNAAELKVVGKTAYGASTSGRIMQGIEKRYGTPYRYGSTGPNTYDCSGFVWSVFNESGVNFTRASARSLWASSEPVSGDDRFKFGTLVFLNGLGHMGIVADENGFYHASSSKGITYSPFKGYWESRIVGFRRLVPQAAATFESDHK